MVTLPVDDASNRSNCSDCVLNLHICYSFESKLSIFFFQKNMSKRVDRIGNKILQRIESHKRGWIFTTDSFADLGTR